MLGYHGDGDKQLNQTERSHKKGTVVEKVKSGWEVMYSHRTFEMEGHIIFAGISWNKTQTSGLEKLCCFQRVWSSWRLAGALLIEVLFWVQQLTSNKTVRLLFQNHLGMESCTEFASFTTSHIWIFKHQNLSCVSKRKEHAFRTLTKISQA